MSHYKRGYDAGLRWLRDPERPVNDQLEKASANFYEIIDTGEHDLEDWLLGYMAALRGEG